MSDDHRFTYRSSQMTKGQTQAVIPCVDMVGRPALGGRLARLCGELGEFREDFLEELLL